MPGEHPTGHDDDDVLLTLDEPLDGSVARGEESGTIVGDYEATDGGHDLTLNGADRANEADRWPPTTEGVAQNERSEAADRRAQLREQMPRVGELVGTMLGQTTLEPDLQAQLATSFDGLFLPMDADAQETDVAKSTDGQFRSLCGRLLEVHSTLQQRGVLADAQFAGLVSQIATLPGMKDAGIVFPELAKRAGQEGGQPMLYLGAYTVVDAEKGQAALVAFEQQRVTAERLAEAQRVEAKLKAEQGGTVAQVCGCCNDRLH